MKAIDREDEERRELLALEISAIQKIDEILTELPDPEVFRVVQYFATKHCGSNLHPIMPESPFQALADMIVGIVGSPEALQNLKSKIDGPLPPAQKPPEKK